MSTNNTKVILTISEAISKLVVREEATITVDDTLKKNNNDEKEVPKRDIKHVAYTSIDNSSVVLIKNFENQDLLQVCE